MPIPMKQASKYFQEFDPHVWSLISFLNWRSEAPDFSLKPKLEHGTFKFEILRIANRDKNEIRAQKAQDMLDNWKNIKHSLKVKKFWNDRKMQSLEQDIKYIQAQNQLKVLQVDSEDLSYALDRSRELNEHANIIGNKRKLVLEKNGERRTKSGRKIPDYRDKSNDKSTDESADGIKAVLKKFEETYLAMDPHYMWTLTTGRKVEKVIYEFAKNLNRESYLHSFIINDADVETLSLFSLDEWKEIKNLKATDNPKLDPSFKRLLKKYTIQDIKKLRSLLFEPFTPDGEEYNRDIHFCLDYINNAYRGILRLWEMDENPFDSLKLEGWFETNVWNRIIDPAFDDLNVDLIREEGVFRLRKDRLKFGAIEAGRKWKEINGTKYMSDSLEMSKMLKDMLDKLIRECKMNEDLVKKLKVVGILHGANRLQILTVDHPKGYITRINHNNIQEVSGRLTAAKPLALVLKEVLYARSIIIETVDMIDRDDDLNIETFLDDDDGFHMPPINITTTTFTTPNKSRSKDMVNEINHIFQFKH
ncbi:c2h2-type zinc finger transcription factor [Gigaspora margarita]|uniref:C2h2-type zinc finger transcription factor n=2 Tax=Gigaspora margarita TaxID=4874 RepID=A0A8H4A515_GIGMA|nr:c2h2-type zinc finger transcription factor [Gigaspora margarita]